MAARMTWPDLWALFNALPDGAYRRHLVGELGLLDVQGRMGEFDQWMRSRSPAIVAEVIHDAPIDVVVLYLCLVPKKEANQIIKARPQTDWPRLTAAYHNPPKLLTGGR